MESFWYQLEHELAMELNEAFLVFFKNVVFAFHN
jgi:hypothetical protein